MAIGKINPDFTFNVLSFNFVCLVIHLGALVNFAHERIIKRFSH